MGGIASPAVSAALDIEVFLAAQEAKDQLRFIICGSVDDGKSTLLGRLLHDSKNIFEDQLAATADESKKYGTQGSNVDFALLVDGLQAEREQGITIDVAYRYFETDKRKFIAADTPGHEQYTRNMATGASTADLAIILVDARKGILTQTRRHTNIISLLGIRNVILAVNKIDLVGYDQLIFAEIVSRYRAHADALGIDAMQAVPVSALTGENVCVARGQTPWYTGPTLISLLESWNIRRPEVDAPFRMPIQRVNRPNMDFRGFCGTIASGSIRKGDMVASSLSGKTTTVTRIFDPSGEVEHAQVGRAVTVLLADEIDISRGDMLARPDAGPEVADQLAASIVWMGDEHLIPGRTYLARFSTISATAQVTALMHKVDVNTLDHHASKTLALNEVGYCKLAFDRPIPFDPYTVCRTTGSFVLIDKYTNATVGAGVIAFGLRRAHNIAWHPMKIGKMARARMNAQKPCVLWFTGLSGSGKSTIADRLEQKLHAMGRRTYLLDGDNIRHGLNKDLGFTTADRVENIRRVAEVAKLMADAGLIVLTAFISPFASERKMARELLAEGEFVEIFVDTPLDICEARDPKGLYGKARSGELKNFTGIGSDYQAPEAAELVLKTAEATPDGLADQIIAYLDSTGHLSSA